MLLVLQTLEGTPIDSLDTTVDSSEPLTKFNAPQNSTPTFIGWSKNSYLDFRPIPIERMKLV